MMGIHDLKKNKQTLCVYVAKQLAASICHFLIHLASTSEAAPGLWHLTGRGPK